MRSTYSSHLGSYRRFSDVDCYYFNAARKTVPGYIRHLRPDIVIFQNTFALRRLDEDVFSQMTDAVGFLRASTAVKVLIASDESLRTDQLCAFINDFGISHVFTFAPEQTWPVIYAGLRPGTVSFHPVLAGYVDDHALRAIDRLAERVRVRDIDVGARLPEWKFFGRMGRLRTELTESFAARAREAGLTTDISSSHDDMFHGNGWFEFLLRCRYTIGMETGSSLLDRDGSILECSSAFVTENPGASFEDLEAACFPGLDGNLDYRALAPRHLEAVMTRTCQVLIEGSYSGVLKPGLHYIELNRDFSNLDVVIDAMANETERLAITERAYRDVVESGLYTYRTYVDLVLGEALGQGLGATSKRTPVTTLLLARNRFADSCWLRAHAVGSRLYTSARARTRRALVRVMGEQALHDALERFRGVEGRNVDSSSAAHAQDASHDADLQSKRESD